METTSAGNVGRSNLPCESASMWVARETDPTPVVARSSEVSRIEPTSSMVLRSHTRGGRSSVAIPDVEMRPEIEFRQEAEIDNRTEIQVSMPAICEGLSGTTRPDISEIASEYVAVGQKLPLHFLLVRKSTQIPPITPKPLLLTQKKRQDAAFTWRCNQSFSVNGVQ